ncbi:alpha/beta-hydrolase [Hypoxylon rubiginosum]|uniref:Alpha/beta-hydrolase n=1 Tax=Hypoxylon rubiginosum TaxID=110542 RepID=A0ACC0CT71_9PEZI|nr:alpha/beta-hydrolase [Hypoxylon rubiginosum]
MYEYIKNPALIHEGPPRSATSMLSKPRVPLILVHDGGGTSFSYHLLDRINRPLYGIENAKLHDGGWWDGGVPEMAAHYVSLLGKILPEGGDILLGGWSMGGLLSLEMAHQIALAAREAKSRETGESSESSGTSTPKTPIFRVLGMIFIDSIFPLRLAELVGPLPEEPIILSGEHSRTMKLKDKVDLNMTHARMMVRFWQVPRWRWRDEAVPVPPTILMRAKEFVNRNPADDQSFVDYTRDLRLLGWDDYDEEHGHFIRDLWEVNGHHFSIFDHKYLDDVTKKVRKAADKLDPPEF